MRERVRFALTQRTGTQLSSSPTKWATLKRFGERQLVERPVTLSALIHDFRTVAEHAAGVSGSLLIAVDELDKLSDTDRVRELLRDVKAIFEVPGVFFLVSVSDEAQRLLDLGALRDRNEFNSSFYSVVRVSPLTASASETLLGSRLSDHGGEPVISRAAARAVSIVTGGVPREIVRIGDLVVRTIPDAKQAGLAEVLRVAIKTEAIELRTEAMSAVSLGGRKPLSDEVKLSMFDALPDKVFDMGDDVFRTFALQALEQHWNPDWPADEVSSDFLEQWRRLLVRLRLAGVLSMPGFPIEDDAPVHAAQAVAQLAARSAAVARRDLERWLRDDLQLGADFTKTAREPQPSTATM